jgi:hypothetical protein
MSPNPVVVSVVTVKTMCLPLQWPRYRRRMNVDLFGLTFVCSLFAASPEARFLGCCYSQSIFDRAPDKPT